jgi:hypothetical protein
MPGPGQEETRLPANDGELQTEERHCPPASWSANRQFKQSKPLQTSASVEKRVHIHSVACAKAAFLLSYPFLSTFGAAWIQCFSSTSGST